MKSTPSIRFRLSASRGVAPYRQLVEQVRDAVSKDQLRPGDRLPPVREVIAQVTINPNTVYRAYRELEYLGVTETRWGVGTFIRIPTVNNDATPTISESLSDWIGHARSRGSNDEEILEMVQARLSTSLRIDS